MTCQNCGSEVPAFNKFCAKCGTPVSATPYSPPGNQAQASWQPQGLGAPVRRKSNVGKVLLIIALVFIVLVAGIGVAIYFGVRSYGRTMKSSAAYALAESRLKESAAVKEKMGEIKSIGFPWGTYQEETGGGGRAVFTMSVEGEKKSGQYFAALTRRNTVWHFDSAMVKLQDGNIINLQDPMETGHVGDDEANTNAGVEENQNSAVDNSNSNRKVTTISGGVLNGKAISKPEPPYPPAAKAARASGTVVVQITVDEKGKVVEAKAVSGHPLLQASAVAAARQARFSPTLLAGKPVKVTGTISYNFILE